MHEAGAAVLTSLVAAPVNLPARVVCGCGGEARYHDHRPKQLLTAEGPVELEVAARVPAIAIRMWKALSIHQPCAA